MLFSHRDVASLARQMQRLSDAPEWAERLGRRGYPFSDDGSVPGMAEHAREIEGIYARLTKRTGLTGAV